jgi:hypothetical protein
MHRKSIHLGEGSRIRNGVVEVWACKRPDFDPYNQGSYAWLRAYYQIGAEFVLVSHTDVGINALRSGLTDRQRTTWYLSRSVDGIPGNSNPEICRLHGWRGTYGDTQTDAHGRRRIVSAHTDRHGWAVVVVGRDLCPDEA